MNCLEYIWIDGSGKLRSKTKVADITSGTAKCHLATEAQWSSFPEWGFDGSSTGQATTESSDVILKSAFCCPDPTRGPGDFLVLCETFTADHRPHSTNSRAALRELLDTKAVNDVTVQEFYAPLFGMEQEYVLRSGGRVLGWPSQGYPAPQGPFYCGVGADEVFGRELVEAHMRACLNAGLKISGVNAEVMPGQWEFQIGPASALEVSDHLWIARWLLYRLGEEFGVSATLDPKPVSGDWNGSGCHTNFSTVQMRSFGGMQVIQEACQDLSRSIEAHLQVYGADNDRRLTGKHETCSIHEFRYGVGDRGASVRIPLHVAKNGCGYLEDRRPAANIDPYQVTRMLISTCCKRD